MTGIDPGSAADWAAALFTGGGLAFAAIQIRQARVEAAQARDRDREAEVERQKSQARAVGISVSWETAADGTAPRSRDGLTPVRVEVLNAGAYPISGVVLSIQTSSDLPMQVVVGTLLPGAGLGEVYRVKRSFVPFGEMTGGVEVAFTDAYDNHWVRTAHSLERTNDPARIC